MQTNKDRADSQLEDSTKCEEKQEKNGKLNYDISV